MTKHLLIWNGTLKFQKAIKWVLKGIGIWEICTNHATELVKWDVGTKVKGISVKIACIDFGGINLNDSPVLIISLSIIDGRSKDNMSQDATLLGGPVL